MQIPRPLAGGFAMSAGFLLSLKIAPEPNKVGLGRKGRMRLWI